MTTRACRAGTKFLPTLPARGATERLEPQCGGHDDFYPRSPRGERQKDPPGGGVGSISTHAPREGSDAMCEQYGENSEISTHAPREGSDPFRTASMFNFFRFLPTLPARGATSGDANKGRTVTDFYPRSPRGERPSGRQSGGQQMDFYPRSPRGERPTAPNPPPTTAGFLPTLPARGATDDENPPDPAKIFLPTLPARGATQS